MTVVEKNIFLRVFFQVSFREEGIFNFTFLTYGPMNGRHSNWTHFIVDVTIYVMVLRTAHIEH